MFSVLFEVKPRSDKWDDYLENAKMLRPELVKIDGFIENIRYKSLQREGWILSLSSWRDEKAVVRWRTMEGHHLVQEKGRNEILEDYHLRVGQYTADNQLPAGQEIIEQRLDQTKTGDGKFVTLINAKRPAEWGNTNNPIDCAQFMGLDYYLGENLIEWDIYESVLEPGNLILMLIWKDMSALSYFEDNDKPLLPDTHRVRHICIIRDYSMFDRREAPQYYPDAKGRPSIHS